MQGWMWHSGQFPLDFVKRYVTYPLVHAGFVHMAFATAILLALGKAVAEVFTAGAVLAVFFAASIAGAVAFSLTGTPGWLLGAYPGVFGILGAFTFLLWGRSRREGRKPVSRVYADRGSAGDPSDLWPAVRDRAGLDCRGCRVRDGVRSVICRFVPAAGDMSPRGCGSVKGHRGRSSATPGVAVGRRPHFINPARMAVVWAAMPDGPSSCSRNLSNASRFTASN